MDWIELQRQPNARRTRYGRSNKSNCDGLDTATGTTESPNSQPKSRQSAGVVTPSVKNASPDGVVRASLMIESPMDRLELQRRQKVRWTGYS